MKENLTVKYSSCKKCKGYFRQAIKESMTPRDKKQFSSEVSKYKLTVNELPLLEFNRLKLPFCGCK
jgi:hypothetical protein